MTCYQFYHLHTVFLNTFSSYFLIIFYVNFLYFLFSQAIRDCFFDLYNEPILETLMQSLTMRYPDVIFPPVPKRGTLDLKSVKESTYFFH